MIIRHEQIRVLAQVAEDGYVARAVAHLERYDPPLAGAAGRAGLEKLARQGLVAARQYDFVRDRTLQLFLEIMMSLGSDFDTDPQFGWLQPYLQPSESMGTVERARLLHFHATSYLNRAYGQNGEYGRAALERAAAITPERIRVIGTDIDTQAMALVQWLHPQRVDFLNEEAVQILVSGARDEARESRLPVAEGTVLIFLLKLTFGHKVLSDPLYPWLERQLRLDELKDESERMQRLVSRSRTYLTMMERTLGVART